MTEQVEDYVDYKYLGNGSAVWPTGHPHRQRSAALCPIIANLVREAQSHGLKFYFKPYELGFPKQLPQLYPLGLHTPAEVKSTRTVLQAKYKELFERTGADGIVLTAEEVHPRGGYGSAFSIQCMIAIMDNVIIRILLNDDCILWHRRIHTCTNVAYTLYCAEQVWH